MNDTIVRHLVALLATGIAGLAYAAGYFSGPHGWWWTVFALFVVYGFVYKTIDAGGHGGGHH
jgi:ABC-type transport system involved in Fe-S cluster assembly fused permease/ATPase subunit